MAQWVVFDPTNWSANYVTAIRTAQTYLQQVQAYQLQYQQYYNMLTNTKSLAAGVAAAALGRSENILLAYRSTAQLLSDASSTYQRAANFGADMNRMSAVSGMSWTDILGQDLQRMRAGRQANAGMYNQAVQIQSSLADIQRRSDQNLQTAQQAEGTVQAVQALAVQNHALGDQMNQLISLSASQQMKQAAKDEQDAQDKEQTKIRAGQDYQAGSALLRRMREFQ